MRLHILAVGRLKPGPEKTLCEDYLRRAEGAGRSCGITTLTVREFPEARIETVSQRMKSEAAALIAALPGRAAKVVLDERGKSLTSAGFAQFLKDHLDRATSDLAFLIGGPDGHAPAIRETADLVLSLGPMTWPHRLARVMLAEQIYRAVTILVNHPYHRP